MSNTYTVVSEISNKDKAMLGILGPGIVRDFFKEGIGAPDVLTWHVIEDAGAEVAQKVDSG